MGLLFGLSEGDAPAGNLLPFRRFALPAVEFAAGTAHDEEVRSGRRQSPAGGAEPVVDLSGGEPFGVLLPGFPGIPAEFDEALLEHAEQFAGFELNHIHRAVAQKLFPAASAVVTAEETGVAALLFAEDGTLLVDRGAPAGCGGVDSARHGAVVEHRREVTAVEADRLPAFSVVIAAEDAGGVGGGDEFIRPVRIACQHESGPPPEAVAVEARLLRLPETFAAVARDADAADPPPGGAGDGHKGVRVARID